MGFAPLPAGFRDWWGNANKLQTRGVYWPVAWFLFRASHFKNAPTPFPVVCAELWVAAVRLHTYNMLEFHLVLVWWLNRKIRPFPSVSGVARGLLHPAVQKWQAKYLKLFWWWKNADKLIPQPYNLHSLFHFQEEKQNWVVKYHLLQPLFCMSRVAKLL